MQAPVSDGVLPRAERERRVQRRALGADGERVRPRGGEPERLVARRADLHGVGLVVAEAGDGDRRSRAERRGEDDGPRGVRHAHCVVRRAGDGGPPDREAGLAGLAVDREARRRVQVAEPGGDGLRHEDFVHAHAAVSGGGRERKGEGSGCGDVVGAEDEAGRIGNRVARRREGLQRDGLGERGAARNGNGQGGAGLVARRAERKRDGSRLFRLDRARRRRSIDFLGSHL